MLRDAGFGVVCGQKSILLFDVSLLAL